MKPNASAALTLPFILLAYACAGQADLDASEAIRAVTRARAVTRTLTAYTAIAAPLLDQDCALGLDAAAEQYLEATDGCATALFADDTSATIQMTACAFEGATCTGDLVLTMASNTATYNACWALAPSGLSCDTYTYDGTLVLGPLSTNSKMLRIIKAKELKYISILDAVVSASALSLTIGEDTFPAYTVTGNIEFGDDNKAAWLAEGQSLVMRPLDGTPRGGILLLDSPAGQLYSTDWLPVSANATRVTTSSRKQRWTGCVETEGAGECKAAGF